jgi:SAM-dependent methyltransferase
MKPDSLLFRWFPKSSLPAVRRAMRLDPNRDWSLDRRAELLEFYAQVHPDLDQSALADEVDRRAYAQPRRDPLFVGADAMTEPELIGAYREASRHQAMRLMLAYDRLGQALPLVNLALRLAPNRRMIDYGCGASDTGLVFWLFGFEVTICDVAGGNLELARWRYARRNASVRVVEAGPGRMYPDLGREAGFIAALEILEHLPDPIQALEKMHQALTPGGLVVVREKSFESRDDDAHLESAHRQWADGSYRRRRDQLFDDLSDHLGRRFRGRRSMNVYRKK